VGNSDSFSLTVAIVDFEALLEVISGMDYFSQR
jgi:hypothetical protein